MQSTPDTGGASGNTSERCGRLTQGVRCNQVIEAAVGLFAQKGFQGTKTKEIAEAAGINEALIFRDFQSKEKLYCSILDYASGRINAAQWIGELSPVAERRDDEALFSRLASKIVENYTREQALFRLMLYCALEQHELARKFRERQVLPVERFIEEYLRARQREGGFREIDPHAVAQTFLSMCHHHVLRRVLFGSGAEPPPDSAAVEAFTRVFLDGVRSR